MDERQEIVRQWRNLLVTLSIHLEKKNVNDLVLLQGIPDGDAENISCDGLKCLQYLERKDKICPDDPGSLLKMLTEIGRNDLKKYVRGFMTKFNGGNSQCVVDAGMKVNHPDYTIKGSPCGICLIISNEIFSPKENADGKREGTLVDEKSLKYTFEWLGFDVELRQNCTANQIYETLKDIADRDHRKYTAFVCCILTHGNKGEVSGTDRKPVEIVAIKKLFEKGICKSLAGKPKIFLIQACRGDDQDCGFIKSPTESSEQACHPHDEQDVEQNFDEFHTEADERANDVRDPAARKVVVCESNFYVVFPSVQGYKAILDKTKGSWLISTICSVLQQNAQTLDLHTMMLKVKQQIADMKSNLGGRYKATPEIEDSLDFENVYFKPSMSYTEYCSRKDESSAVKNGAND